MSVEKVRYIYKIDQLDGDNYPRYNKLEVESTFINRYYNVFALLAGLNSCSRDLIDYLVEVMDDDNIVRSDDYTRKAFLTVLQEKTMQKDKTFISYSDSNIKKAYQTLVSRDCLIKLNKGLYKVNPVIYFKKSQLDRLEDIKLIMEFKKGVRNSDMQLIAELNEPEETYGSK